MVLWNFFCLLWNPTDIHRFPTVYLVVGKSVNIRAIFGYGGNYNVAGLSLKKQGCILPTTVAISPAMRTPPAMQTPLPAMHAPLPCMPQLCTPLPCHTCSLPCMPPATHPTCHACPAMHAPHHTCPLPCMPPLAMHTPCHACPPPWTEWQTHVKTLPCRNFVAGGKYNSAVLFLSQLY